MLLDPDAFEDFLKKNPETMIKMAQAFLDSKYPEKIILTEMQDIGYKNPEKVLSLCQLGIQKYPFYEYRYLQQLSSMYLDLAEETKSEVYSNLAIQYIDQAIISLQLDTVDYSKNLSSLYFNKYCILKFQKKLDQALDSLNNSFLQEVSIFDLVWKCELLLKLNRLTECEKILNACIYNIKPLKSWDYSKLIDIYELIIKLNTLKGNHDQVELAKNKIFECREKELELLIKPRESKK